jgi:hypothetical protein
MRVGVRTARRDGSRRTITLRLRVPRAVHGPRLLQIRGTSLDGGDATDLLGALSSVISIDLGGSEPPPGPHSVNQLAADIASIHRYDGMYARFAPPRGAAAKGPAVYRDPRERISGRADVPVIVLPPR